MLLERKSKQSIKRFLNQGKSERSLQQALTIIQSSWKKVSRPKRLLEDTSYHCPLYLENKINDTSTSGLVNTRLFL